MGAASAISGGLGLVGGIYGAIQGAKERRDAERALNDYQRQELNNVAEGLQVSTLGSDLQREEQSRLASGQIGALREGGTRTLIGGLGRVEAGNQRVMAQTGADLDMQQKQIDQMRAEDEARIRSMQENREIGDLSALSSQLQSGKQDMNMGMGNIVQGVGMFGRPRAEGVQKPYVEGDVNQITPQGIIPLKTNLETPIHPNSQFGQLGRGMFGGYPNSYVNNPNR